MLQDAEPGTHIPPSKYHCRRAPNVLDLENVRGIIEFVMQYAESLLPGCIPGYKWDDIQLLPSSTTKKVVWLLYEESIVSDNVRPVACATFCNVWRNFLGHVVVCKTSYVLHVKKMVTCSTVINVWH